MSKSMGQSLKQAVSVALASTVVLGYGAANAVFTVPTELTDSATNVGLVGAAVFGIAIGIKLYKWLRNAL